MSFFERPARKEQKEPKRPRWLGPPDDELGVVLPLELTLVRTERALVSVRSLTAYREGFSIATAAYHDVDADPFGVVFGFWPESAEDLPDDFLRFGVEFADGSRATNVQRFPPEPDPVGPIMTGGRGDLGVRRMEHEYWVWPLPPPGPLAFVCEWPSEEIGVTREAIGAGVVREAAGRATTIWD